MNNLDQVSVSLSVTGISQTPTLNIAPGISVFTGQNNTGKSRILQHIHLLKNMSGFPSFKFQVDVKSHEYGNRSLRVNPQEPNNMIEFVTTSDNGQVNVNWATSQNGGNSWTIKNKVNNHSRNFSGVVSIQEGTDNDQMLATLMNSIVYVPPQRLISATVSTQPVPVPDSSGGNVGQVLYFHRNNITPEFFEFQRIVAAMFPEIEEILTLPTSQQNVTITILDRYSKERIPLDKCGTGVQQALHLVALVLFSPSGRIFLIDEPHVYLHATAERALAEFLRQHPEHSYVVATHSPVLIDALEPDRLWLVTRDEYGSAVQPIYGKEEWRKSVFTALGWRPSQFAWAQRIIFVEGESDVQVYGEWFKAWGWVQQRTAVVQLRGFGTSKPLTAIIGELRSLLFVDMLFYLDGDQNGQVSGEGVMFLPELEIENILIRDVAAVRRVLLIDNALITADKRERLERQWSEESIQRYLNEHSSSKGSKRLIDLCHELGFRYEKTLHNPLIAAEMDISMLEDVRNQIEPFVTGREVTKV